MPWDQACTFPAAVDNATIAHKGSWALGPSTASPPQSTEGHRGAQPPSLAAQGEAQSWCFVSGGAINKSVGGGGGDESEARRRESHFLRNELTKSGMPRCSGAK